jgi:hypothetical protein
VQPEDIGRPVGLRPNDYSVVAVLGRSAPSTAAEDAVAANVVLTVDGTVVVRQPVRVDDLPPDGTMRGIPLNLTLRPGQQVRATVQRTGAVGVAIGAVQFAPLNGGDSGVGQTGTRYPDIGPVVAWTAVVAALAAAMAVTLRRRERRRTAIS